MEINGETQLKDLIPEGYEPSGTSGMSLCRGEEHITVSIKRKEVKDFKWYWNKYSSTGVLRNFKGVCVQFENGDYDQIPFEFKIGLLKFICDDFGVPFRLFLSGEYAESPKYSMEISKLKSVCPPKFLNSIFN